MKSEKEYLQDYVTARREVAELKAKLTEANERSEQAETALLNYMDDNGIKSTAKYEGLGRISITAPMLFASINEGQEDAAFNYLHEIGENAAIKQSVHWKRLASIIKSKLEEGKVIPECFKYYLKQTTRYEPSES